MSVFDSIQFNPMAIATFSTGIRYRLFSPIDIRMFGGWMSLRNPHEIRWTAEEDLGYVGEQLAIFQLPTLDPTPYEKTAAGYEVFMGDLLEMVGFMQDEDEHEMERMHSYLMGYSIYFQLLMVPVLTVDYDFK